MSMKFREIVEVVEVDPMRRRKGLEGDDPSFSPSTNNNDRDASKKIDDDLRSAVTRAATKGDTHFFYDADGNIEEFPDIDGLTEKPDKKGLLPLTIATHKGYLDITDALLHLGANINGQSLGAGQTALMHAAAFGHTDIVKLLLENGADVGIKTKKGHTALYFAKTDEIKQLLIQAKAVPQKNRKKDPYGDMPEGYGPPTDRSDMPEDYEAIPEELHNYDPSIFKEDKSRYDISDFLVFPSEPEPFVTFDKDGNLISSLKDSLAKNTQVVQAKEDKVPVKDYGVPTSPPNIPDNEPDAALTVSALKNKMLR